MASGEGKCFLDYRDRDGRIAVHIYGPAIRRNPDHPDDLVPIWAIHQPPDYRTFVLVDHWRAFWMHDLQIEGVACKPGEVLIPTGEGGSVIAAVFLRGVIEVTTMDPWNWVGGRPPTITVGEGESKIGVYKRVVKTYSKKGV